MSNESSMQRENAWLGSRFVDVNLSDSAFDDVNSQRTTFENVNLTAARFRNINLSSASIEHANLEGLRIDGVLVTDLFRAYNAATSGRP